ncbi:MAG: carbohydrate porin [Deltaproteobacteria bacterium]|nr:carbohydrate porin [Deltaproteobacteria bacterium]
MLFWDAVGMSATYDSEFVQLRLGVGDSGFGMRGLTYSTIPTAGGWLKFHVPHFEVGVGGEYRYEPEVKGNKNAPYSTPGIAYEDYLRREVVKRWLEEHPGQSMEFPNPESTSSQSYKAVGYLGFGGFGPLRWNKLYANWERLHPLTSYSETYSGQAYEIFIHDLTDERYSYVIGNEMELSLVPERLDAVWAVMYGGNYNNKNEVAPGDDNRWYLSTVLRLQLYLTRTLHLLAESSVAQEKSTQGNLYREHFDSIFQNTDGAPDARGLETGDSDTRNTWQLKGGFVINPNGMGVFNRPSLRILYGLQYSSQQAAYGNSFVQSLDQYNVFTGSESHWHHVLAIEAEAWF